VHRIIRRIEIENDLFGSPHMRLHEQVDQQRPDRHRIVTDLVVARRRKLAQLQPVKRRLAGDRRAVLVAPRACLPAPPSADRGAARRGR